MKDFIRELQSYPRIGTKLLLHKHEIKPTKVNVGVSKEVYFLHYAPVDKKHQEVILYIHPGGWNSKAPKDFTFIGERLASEGYECFLMGYRRVPHVHYNEIIEDVCIEYKAILQYLKSKGIPANRVIVMGSSAGAHLGNLLVYDKELHQKYRWQALIASMEIPDGYLSSFYRTSSKKTRIGKKASLIQSLIYLSLTTWK